MVSVTHGVNMWVGRSQYTENWPWAPERHNTHFVGSLLIPVIKIKFKKVSHKSWHMDNEAGSPCNSVSMESPFYSNSQSL